MNRLAYYSARQSTVLLIFACVCSCHVAEPIFDACLSPAFTSLTRRYHTFVIDVRMHPCPMALRLLVSISFPCRRVGRCARNNVWWVR